MLYPQAADRAARRLCGIAPQGWYFRFPVPAESACDTFISGHGSTALSTAIGVARAKRIKGEPGKVVAIIGDGAFTGGMVYEGMNNIGMLNNLIVVLNDNKMSISKTLVKWQTI